MGSPQPPQSSRVERWPAAAWVTVIVGLVCLAYSNSFSGAFVYDDEPSILQNASIRNIGQAWTLSREEVSTVSGRPLLNVSFALNYLVSGLQPWSYHLLNLVIHLTTGLLLFGLLRMTLQLPAIPERIKAATLPLAGLTALLWCVHPLQTGSVTYIVQRAESLVSLFYIGTLYCFVRAVTGEPNRSALFWSVFLCAGGMLTKEVMVTAPVIVLLFDRAFVSGSLAAAWRSRRVYYSALAGTWMILVVLVAALGGNRGGTSGGLTTGAPWLAYWLTQFRAVATYLRLAVWPGPLVFNYAPTWWQNSLGEYISVVAVSALAISALYLLVRRPMIGFVAFTFFGLLAPTSIIPGSVELVAEHRAYLALALVMTALVLAGSIYIPKYGQVFLVVAAIFAALTWRRNEDYQSAIRLYEDTVRKAPDDGRAWALLGDYYRRSGNLTEARRALEKSVKAERVGAVLDNLGEVCAELGEAGQASEYFRQALALNGSDIAALGNLGNQEILTGNLHGLEYLQRAFVLSPQMSAVGINLGNAQLKAGRPDDALQTFATVAARHPGDSEVFAAWANALLDVGRYRDAVARMRSAIALNPQNGEWHNRLGLALARAGELQEASREFDAAVRLSPENQSARQNAELARRRLGGQE